LVPGGTRASDTTFVPDDADVEKMIARAAEVRRWWETPERDRLATPDGVVGLALSGGGIRSATFSLGLLQALAKDKLRALAQVDILSSVSGGGYSGCFLRSLFVPDEARGIRPANAYDPAATDKVELDKDAVADQCRFAYRVLQSGTDEHDLSWPSPSDQKRRNPLWWLREHSRYLAPNGPTDYSYAFAYLARNWLAMLYVFLLASLAIASTIVAVEAALADKGWLGPLSWTPIGSQTGPQPVCTQCLPKCTLVLPVSPVFLLALLPIVASMVFSVAYWMTEAMSPNEPKLITQEENLAAVTLLTVIGALLILTLAESITPGALDFPRAAFRPPTRNTILVWGIAAGVVIMIAASIVALVTALLVVRWGEGLTSELRARLSRCLSNSNLWFLAIVGVGLVDSLGAGTAYWLRYPARISIGTATVLPVIAYLIKKLPDWFGPSSKANAFSRLQRFFNAIALVSGLILFGLVAVTACAMVHFIAWRCAAWLVPTDWPHLWLTFGTIWVLAVLSGLSTGFINLSSLHFLYASRLTRAYLGATNNSRLTAATVYRRGGKITEAHSADYIQPDIYMRADLPAPIHVINTTINETIAPQSQLVARDRKGDILSLEPGGIHIANIRPLPWKDVGHGGSAEQLSLGQWCAISGAAASSGMGRMTSLGLALAFTFANVRLGYWWWSPRVLTGSRKPNLFWAWASVFFGTFIYLFNEMTARYSRDYVRKYITDGGHFENTGAYRLIEARVPLILLSDNGADPDYRFEDFENLVRKVRLDMGYEMDVVAGDELDAFLAELKVENRDVFVDPERWPDWRAAFKSAKCPGHVLAVRVRTGNADLKLLWLKPRMLCGLPSDILGYASANPQFPQQPTGDQFFDEAQWESYRKLGEISMDRLLASCPGLLAPRPATK